MGWEEQLAIHCYLGSQRVTDTGRHRSDWKSLHRSKSGALSVFWEHDRTASETSGSEKVTEKQGLANMSTSALPIELSLLL